MNDYNDFDEWFNQRSKQYYNDSKCPDPFLRNDILKEWLKNAWSLGYNSAITNINEKQH